MDGLVALLQTMFHSMAQWPREKPDVVFVSSVGTFCFLILFLLGYESKREGFPSSIDFHLHEDK